MLISIDQLQDIYGFSIVLNGQCMYRWPTGFLLTMHSLKLNFDATNIEFMSHQKDDIRQNRLEPSCIIIGK